MLQLIVVLAVPDNECKGPDDTSINHSIILKRWSKKFLVNQKTRFYDLFYNKSFHGEI